MQIELTEKNIEKFHEYGIDLNTEEANRIISDFFAEVMDPAWSTNND